MKYNATLQQIFGGILIISSLVGCAREPIGGSPSATPTTFTSPIETRTTLPQPDSTPERTGYEFPTPIDPAKPYLFYLHGRIIEDQGIQAVSPDYGEYEYERILETFSGYGFVVISEQRPKGTDGVAYARKIKEQISALLKAGVPAKDITVVGASKGGYIAIFASHFLENEDVNFVVMGICHPDDVKDLIQAEIVLFGDILSIYDASDVYAGSCQEYFSFSESSGTSRHDEIVLNIGTGHGILYQPLDEWIIPAVQWAKNNSP
jgi:hypothetical protein